MRLLVGMAAAAAIGLGLLGVSVYLAMRIALFRDFNASLAIQARLVSGMLDLDDGRLKFDFDPQQMPDFVAGNRQNYFEIWRQGGTVFARSPSLGSDDLLSAPPTDDTLELTLPNSHEALARRLVFQPSDEENRRSPAPTVIIVVASRPLSVHRTLGLLAWMLALLCGGVLIILVFALWRVASAALTPLRRLADEIAAIHEEELGVRLNGSTVPPELLPVVEKLNQLLARLEGAFVREKSFTSDVSHELRTPLAGLRSTLEVCRSRPRQPAEYEAALDDCAAITDRMEGLVQSLLLLARSDAGQLPVQWDEVDLHKCVMECWKNLQPRATARQLHVKFDIPTDCRARTDEQKIGMIVGNLLDNAVSYANDAGNVSLSIRRATGQPAGAWQIEISNSGSRLSASDAARVFDRFWRGDSARTEQDSHFGLGLSICQRLSKLLKAKLEIQSSPAGDFVVLLHVPNQADFAVPTAV
jgi:signal transduction histidine kinase